jgi:hypothetical protein
MNSQQTPPRGLAAILGTPQGAALAAILTATLIYLLIDHTAHVLAVLPYAFILLCPLMHLFMMRGMHDGHADHTGHSAQDNDDRTNQRPQG